MYHGINNIDQQLHKYLPNKNGFFIEAGANNGINQSNTLFFERDLGWKGILIEPVPELAELCRNNRTNPTINAALVASDYNLSEIVIEYTPKSSGLMSVIKGMPHTAQHLKKAGNEEGSGRMVPAMTLDQILRIYEDALPSRMDLLVLDVEGYEPEALSGLHIAYWNIEYICIEQQYNSKSIDKLLLPFYTKIDQLSEHDFLWKRK